MQRGRRQENGRHEREERELLKQPANESLEVNQADVCSLEFRRRPCTFPQADAEAQHLVHADV